MKLNIFNKKQTLPVLACALVACNQTRNWEEEVRLNTGESLWVKRSMVYTFGGAAGNPLDMQYKPVTGKEKFTFEWKGKQYKLNGQGGFKVLAISPEGKPILIMNADAGRWDAKVGYKCTVPFYVQFVPDESGAVWGWPPAVEPWVINLPTNLLLEVGDPSKLMLRYTVADKMRQSFWSDPHENFLRKIDENYTSDRCGVKEKVHAN